MKQLKLSWLWLFSALMISGGVFVGCQKDAASPDVTSNAKGGSVNPKTYAKPTLVCLSEMNTQSTIYLKFVPGEGGAPAGFSIQWMSTSAFALGPDGLENTSDDNSWYDSADPRLCKASFSGKANGANYNLSNGSPGMVIAIGELLPEYAYFSGGAVKSADPACIEFDCGQSFVFRAFAHGDNKLGRSEFSQNTTCATEECPPVGSDCAKKKWYGWWKKASNFANVKDPMNTDPDFMTVGAFAYSANEIYNIMNTNPNAGNGLLILAHQLISSKLNILNGAIPTDENSAAIVATDQEIGSKNLFTTIMSKSELDAKIGPLHKFNSSCN